MRKRIFSSALALCLLLSLLPGAAFAAGEGGDASVGDGSETQYVAQIGDTQYTDFSTAVTSANSGDIIQLLDNISLTSPISINTSITLDLNGKTITSTGLAFNVAIEDGQFVVKDSQTDGKITSSNTGNLIQVSTGEVIVEGGTLTNNWYVIYAFQNGKATVKGGTLQSSVASALSTNGSAQGSEDFSANAVLTVEGGKLVSTSDVTIYLPAGTLNISGGEIEGATAVYSKCGTTTITAGTIKGTGTNTSFSHSGGGCNATGDAMVIEACNYPNGNPIVKISGGTFTSTSASAIGYYEYQNNQAEEITVTGGSFSSDVRDYVPVDYECVSSTLEDSTTYTVQAKTGLSADAENNNGTATATIDGSYSENNNDKGSVDESNSTLSITATTGESGANEEVSSSNITISANALTSVNETANVSNVEIITDVGTLTVNAAAWAALTANATDEETGTSPVVLCLEKTAAMSGDTSSPLTYTLTAKADGEDVFDATSANGQITVTVPYTKTGNANPQVYYVSATGSENMNATYTDSEEGGGTGTLSWVTTHFSEYVVVDGDSTSEVMLTTSERQTTFTSLSEALTSAATSGGTITLLKDVTLTDLNVTINSDVIIAGTGKIDATVASGKTTVGITINSGKTLTLDGVALTINGNKNSTDNEKNDGTALSLTSGSNLKLVNKATLAMENLNRGVIMVGKTAPVDGTVTVDGSTLTAKTIDGNFSNGGKFVFQNGSTATIDGCGSYGLSANVVTVDGSTLTVKNTGYAAIYASDDNSEVKVVNGGQINVSESGKNLPYTGSSYSEAYSPIELGYKANATLTVDKTSSITLTENANTNSEANNTINLSSTATLDNKGTITGTINTPKVTDGSYQIVYMVDGQTYYLTTVTPEENATTVTFTAPANPSKSGYTFTGWDYGTAVTVSNGAATLTPEEGKDTYTFTAQWRKNSSGGGGTTVTNYTLTFNTNGGSAIAKVTKSANTTIDLTGYTPTRSGYTFVGWYSDTSLTQKVTSVKLTGNITVYAKWEETATPTPDFPFTDVTSSDYYYDAVVWAVEQAITTGDTPTTFAPNAGCTRGQIVTFLWRAAGSPAPKTTVNPFTDVSSNDYYYEAVLWAVEQEITNGTSPTTFSPNDTCTRAHAVTFLYRDAGSPAASGSNPFTDVPAGEYYSAPVLWAVANGVTTGDTPTTFAPNSTCTRGQIVTFLYRAAQ